MPWPVVAAALGLCAVTGLLAARVFDDVRAAGLAAMVIVAVPALAVRRLPGEVRGVVHLVALVGGLVVTALAAGGRVPADVYEGVVGGSGDLLSVSWPAPLDAGLFVVVAMLVGAASIVTAELAAAGRWRLTMLAPSAGLGLVLGALGAPAGRPAILGVGAWIAAALVVLFTSETVTERRRRPGGTAFVAAGAMLAGTVVVAGSFAVLPAWSARDRLDPRSGRAISAEDLFGYESLAGVAVERATEPAVPVARLSGASSAYWRLFALDRFDGVEWGIGPTFRRVGRRLGPPAVAVDPAQSVVVTVEPLGRSLTWLPIAGTPTLLDHGASADRDRSMLLLEPDVAVGGRVSATMSPIVLDDSLLGGPDVGDPADEVSAAFRSTAEQLIASATTSGAPGDGLYGALRALEVALRTTYRINRDSPVSTSVGSLKAVLESSRQGAEEQYVAAFALMARSLGASARVAVGYRPPPTSTTLTSADAHAWPEVWFGGVGWVPFDPVPSAEAVDAPVPARPIGDETPAVLPDPAVVAGEEPAVVRPAPQVATPGRRPNSVNWLALAGVSVVIVVGGAVLAAAASVLAKRRRRHRRLGAAGAPDRVVGAWAEATDALVDHGASFHRWQTNADIAAEAGRLIDAEGVAAATSLAGLATAAAHAQVEPDDLTVALASRLMAQVDDSLRAGRRRLDRFRARITLRSFRRDSRSPVR